MDNREEKLRIIRDSQYEIIQLFLSKNLFNDSNNKSNNDNILDS